MMQRLVPLSMAIIGVFLVGCDWMPGKPTRAQESVLPTDVHAFNTLYSANCSGCHGTNGQFGAARPLNDPLYLSLADTAYLVQVTGDGVHDSLMPPFGRKQGGGLTSQQVSDIVNGMHRTWGNAGDEDSQAAPPLVSSTKGNPARGASLFTSHCAACHGKGGTGGQTAGSVVDSTYLALVSDQALRSVIICGRLDLGMPTWRGTLNGSPAGERDGLPPLNDRQISDLVAFLASHRVEFPGAPFPSLSNPRGSGTQVP
jgi:mono/diheme cytochrome c family protein